MGTQVVTSSTITSAIYGLFVSPSLAKQPSELISAPLDETLSPRHTFTSPTETEHIRIKRQFALQTIELKIENADLMRQNAQLSTTLQSANKALSVNAFAAFRDRLLLANKVWQLERENKALRQAASGAETQVQEIKETSDEQLHALEKKLASIEKARLADFAQREALDEKRDLLVEELIDEIAADLEESQLQVKLLSSKMSEKDQEIESIHNIWLLENERLAKEVEQLKRGQAPMAVEEDVFGPTEHALQSEITETRRQTEEAMGEDGELDSEDDDFDGSSYSGSPTPTIAEEYDDALDESILVTKKVRFFDEQPAFPSPKRSPSFRRSLYANNVNPVLLLNPIKLVDTESPTSLDALSHTTHNKLLVRCKRATKQAFQPLKSSLWPSRGSSDSMKVESS